MLRLWPACSDSCSCGLVARAVAFIHILYKAALLLPEVQQTRGTCGQLSFLCRRKRATSCASPVCRIQQVRCGIGKHTGGGRQQQTPGGARSLARQLYATSCCHQVAAGACTCTLRPNADTGCLHAADISTHKTAPACVPVPLAPCATGAPRCAVLRCRSAQLRRQPTPLAPGRHSTQSSTA